MKTFKIFGYSVDYFQNGKYIGCVLSNEPDRELFGYYGRQQTTYTGELKKGNKTVQVSGQFYTECFPLCGKLK